MYKCIYSNRQQKIPMNEPPRLHQMFNGPRSLRSKLQVIQRSNNESNNGSNDKSDVPSLKPHVTRPAFPGRSATMLPAIRGGAAALLYPRTCLIAS